MFNLTWAILRAGATNNLTVHDFNQMASVLGEICSLLVTRKNFLSPPNLRDMSRAVLEAFK
jgi:hypothetical protein